jgi:hypothetical protein
MYLIEEVGPEPAKLLQLRSIALYNFSAAYARERGIIIADTKFEFGYIDGELHVIDEILTPDSSDSGTSPTTRQAGRLEQATAGSASARGCRRGHEGALRGGVPAPHRPRSAIAEARPATELQDLDASPPAGHNGPRRR